MTGHRLFGGIRVVLVLVCAGSSSAVSSQEVRRSEALSRISLPALAAFRDRMDVPVDEVIGWMHATEAQLMSEKFDCRSKASISMIFNTPEGEHVQAWDIALRSARNPVDGTERYIVVRQNPDDNLAIAMNEGFAEDNRSHIDIVRTGKTMYCSSLTAFDYHVGAVDSTLEWNPKLLQFYLVYDPVRVCTSSVSTVLAGFAQYRPGSSIAPSVVKGIVEKQNYVHVLVSLPILNASRPLPDIEMIFTFENEVPVQVVRWRAIEEGTGVPIPCQFTRSEWKIFGDEGSQQRLPSRIKGMTQFPRQVGEMTVSCEWILGNSVDERLFKPETVGMFSPAENIAVGIPKVFVEMLEGKEVD